MIPKHTLPLGAMRPPGIHPSAPPSQLPPPPRAPRPAFFNTVAHVQPNAHVQAHPLMAPLYWSCAELFGIASDVKGGHVPFASAVDLRNVVDRELATMMDRARSAGVTTDDILESQYALVALLDEVIVRAPWAGQGEWRIKPLQLLRFNENTAGENFFRRLATLEGQPHRVHVLQIYYLCMAVGFQGRFAFTQGEGLAATYDRVGSRVAEGCAPDVISPHGEPREKAALLKGEAPLVKIGLGFFGLALVLFVILRAVLGLEVRSAAKPMEEYSTTTLRSGVK